ncbi:DUF3224 domain-containing protein [Streptomyces albofaciens JCM 4342]|uniref:DUF3224 domain-containing protein n=1 Tax=Streptomyces albofaciens TaxID=66866 RepID=UPI001238BEF3|nr:DUF3224 domain-containing protein [Streptomyces albofaciens]KAA6223686.1 DUF3224 domain-containing protein [Streptomyces albofaciens JCM 4342]
MSPQNSAARTRLTGHFTYADWQERALGNRPDGTCPRLAHAAVVNAFSGGIEAAGTTCEYTIVYVTGKTGTFTGMELLDGSVDGRRGTFVVEERGSFDERGSVRCAFEVVPGSGTGDLAGLRGTGAFTHEPGQTAVPYTFDYDFG